MSWSFIVIELCVFALAIVLAPHARRTGTSMAEGSYGAVSRMSMSSPTSAAPSARRSARVVAGSRFQSSSPTMRRMNRSAASSVPAVSAHSMASLPAVASGHHGSHGIGGS